MQPRAFPDTPADLDGFLAANIGCVLDADIGPWLGQAALASSTPEAVGPAPAGWQEAVNAALPSH